MRHHTTFAIGAILAAIGIAFGAFGAHGLEGMVEPDMLANWETGVRYHMYAALALLVLGLRPEQRKAPLFLIGGLTIFSGSLYLMTLTGARWLGAITPIGGSLLVAGLLLAALDARKAGRSETKAPADSAKATADR